MTTGISSGWNHTIIPQDQTNERERKKKRSCRWTIDKRQSWKKTNKSPDKLRACVCCVELYGVPDAAWHPLDRHRHTHTADLGVRYLIVFFFILSSSLSLSLSSFFSSFFLVLHCLYVPFFLVPCRRCCRCCCFFQPDFFFDSYYVVFFFLDLHFLWD